MKKSTLGLCLLVCALLANPVVAQIAELVDDLSLGGETSTRFRVFDGVIDDTVLFRATTATGRIQLWGSDGSPEGTRILADFATAQIDGVSSRYLFFRRAERAFPDGGLWRTDGTMEGTVPIVGAADLHPHASASFEIFEDALFGLLETDTGLELWRTDGTEEGTGAVAAFSGPGTAFASMHVVGSTLFFAIHRSGGLTWYSYSQGRVQDRGSLPSPAIGRISVGSRLYMHSRSTLYAVDEVDGGVRIVAGFGPGTIRSTQAFGDSLLVMAETQTHREYWLVDEDTSPARLWRGPTHTKVLGVGEGFALFGFGLDVAGIRISDGTVGGTSLLRELCGSCAGPADTRHRSYSVGGRVFLQIRIPEGHSLWVIDGTEEGSREVIPAGRFFLEGAWTGSSSGDFYFIQSTVDEPEQRELWRVRAGSYEPEQLTRLGDRGTTSLDPRVAELGSELMFWAGDEASGVELWRTEGELGSENPLAVFPTASLGSDPTGFSAMDDRLVFAAGDRIVTTDGSAVNTEVLEAVDEGTSPVAAESGIFFRRDGDLWFIESGTGAVRRVYTTPDERILTGDGVVWNGFLVIPLEGPTSIEFVLSDGTAGGTGSVLTLGGSGGVGHLTAIGSHLYFALGSVQNQNSLVRCDTVAGACDLLVPGMGTNPPLNDPLVTRLGNRVVYLVRRLSEPIELHAVDLDTGLPTLLLEHEAIDRSAGPGVHPIFAPGFGYEIRIAVMDGRAYYLVNVGDDVARLWRTDGTAAGTELVLEFPYLDVLTGTLEPGLFAAGGELFFAGSDPAEGVELWKTDGTAAGTSRVKDLLPGSLHGAPRDFAAGEGQVFFSARSESLGRELWITDGTPEGTRLAHDIAPGRRSSEPEDLTRVGDTLFFSADDGLRGRELWAVDLLAGPGCQPSPTSLCLARDRFRAEMLLDGPDGSVRPAGAVGISDAAGYYYFADAGRVEAALKILDGRSLNGHFWTFAAGLTDREYWLDLTDVETGATRRYFNPSRRVGSIGDTEAFGPRGASSQAFTPFEPPIEPDRLRVSSLARRGAPPPCAPTDQRLCLEGGRFAVEASWRDSSGDTRAASAVTLSDGSGYFWFFREANVESLVKVLDGRAVNGAHWVFVGGLSAVEHTLTITDTETGVVKSYFNPSGEFGSVGDTRAFVEPGLD